MWSEMSEAFGPIKTLLGALPPERAESFRRELIELFEREKTAAGVSMARPYILIFGIRKS
jgi:hypothetical protein